MATWQARNPEEFARQLEAHAKQYEKMQRVMGLKVAEAVTKAARPIQARAKEIIKEKGHVVTGDLGRSINVLPFVERDVVGAEIGSFMEYSVFVEALPDGGYLGPAFEQRHELASKILIEEGFNPAFKEWGKR